MLLPVCDLPPTRERERVQSERDGELLTGPDHNTVGPKGEKISVLSAEEVNSL